MQHVCCWQDENDNEPEGPGPELGKPRVEKKLRPLLLQDIAMHTAPGGRISWAKIKQLPSRIWGHYTSGALRAVGMYARRTAAAKRKYSNAIVPDSHPEPPDSEPEDVPQTAQVQPPPPGKSKKKSKRRKEGYTEEEDAFIVCSVKSSGPNKATWQSIINDRDWGEAPPSALAIKVPTTPHCSSLTSSPCNLGRHRHPKSPQTNAHHTAQGRWYNALSG